MALPIAAGEHLPAARLLHDNQRYAEAAAEAACVFQPSKVPVAVAVAAQNERLAGQILYACLMQQQDLPGVQGYCAMLEGCNMQDKVRS